MRNEFIAKILKATLQGFNCTWCMGAMSVSNSANKLRLPFKNVQVRQFTLSLINLFKNLLDPRQTFTTGCTKAAGLSGEELLEVGDHSYMIYRPE